MKLEAEDRKFEKEMNVKEKDLEIRKFIESQRIKAINDKYGCDFEKEVDKYFPYILKNEQCSIHVRKDTN